MLPGKNGIKGLAVSDRKWVPEKGVFLTWVYAPKHSEGVGIGVRKV